MEDRKIAVREPENTMATETTEQFDPYRKWLGIPPKDQPPHHYRLLGIAAFESDPDVIQNAADRQMAHVRNFQAGKHSQQSQRILNELAAAKLCLLTEAKKAEYDKELRVRLRAKKAAAAQANAPAAATATPVASVPTPPVAAAVPTAAAEPPPEEPSVSPSPKISARKTVVHRRRRKKNNTVPIAIAVVCLGVLVVGGLVVVSQLGGKKEKPSSKEKKKAAENAEQLGSKKSTEPPAKNVADPSPKDGTKLPTTHPPKRTRNGKPLDSVFTDPKSGEFTEPPKDPKKELQDLLERIRLALATRDYDTVTTNLAKAYELSPDPEQAEKLNHLRDLSAFARQFWDAVASGVKQFEKAMSFEFEGKNYEFISKEGKNLTFRVDGVEVSKRIQELEPRHALALALNQIDEGDVLVEGDIFKKFDAIAFLVVDNRGDTIAQRKRAESMMREMPRDRLPYKVLAAELNLDAGIPLPKPDDTEPLPQKPLGGLGELANGSRAPVPSKEDLEQAEADLQIDAQKRLARTVPQRMKLANDLNEGAKKESDLAKKYKLWSEALELAIEVRRVQLSMTITDSMAQAFEIDSLSQKEKVLAELAVKSGVDVQAVSTYANQLFRKAVDEKKFDVAQRLGDIRIRTAKRMKQFDVVNQIEKELQELKEQQQAPESGQEAEDLTGT